MFRLQLQNKKSWRSGVAAKIHIRRCRRASRLKTSRRNDLSPEALESGRWLCRRVECGAVWSSVEQCGAVWGQTMCLHRARAAKRTQTATRCTSGAAQCVPVTQASSQSCPADSRRWRRCWRHERRITVMPVTPLHGEALCVLSGIYQTPHHSVDQSTNHSWSKHTKI